MKLSGNHITKLAKSFIGRIIFGLNLHRRIIGDAAVVVSFHRVNDKAEMDGMTCSLKVFEEYCRFFKKYFRVAPLKDIVRKLEKDGSFQGELAITFDDGYRDNYENAAIILKNMRLPATFFVVTGFIGSCVVPWWDRQSVVSHPWMTWEQVMSLQRQGFEIGSHTRTHANMGEIAGNTAVEEIAGSQFDLQERLGHRVDLFAYPYGGPGNMLNENREIVKAAGFRCCCSAYGGINLKGVDPLQMRRFCINAWYISPFHFAGDLIVKALRAKFSGFGKGSGKPHNPSTPGYGA